MSVHITQALCPKRHCIIALAYENDGTPGESDRAIAKLRRTLESLIADRTLNGYCGLCSSTEIAYEDGATRFKTMEEAKGHIEQIAREQLATRRFLLSQRAQRN